MSAKITLSIPDPCHQNWNTMTPTEQGRFCGSCQKQVVDFSSMTDKQLIEFFTKQKENVCGRFQQTQLDRVVAAPKKSLPWVKYFFQISLPAFLLSLKTQAQSGWEKGVSRIYVSDKGDTAIVIDEEPIIKKDSIKGKVVDTDGNGIAFATIMIKGTKIGKQTKDDGSFVLEKHFIDKPLVISAVGFQSKEVTVTKDSNIVLVQMESLLAGEVVVVVGYAIPRKKKTVPLLEWKKPKINSNISVYPNPVIAGEAVNLNWKQLKAGDYLIEVVSTGGQMVFNQRLRVEVKTGATVLRMPQLAAGIYTIKLTSKAGGKPEAVMIAIQ